jgi:hypothetical protein
MAHFLTPILNSVRLSRAPRTPESSLNKSAVRLNPVEAVEPVRQPQSFVRIQIAG